MKKHDYMTHKEAVKIALEKLGGRARTKDIYPLVIPFVKYKPGSNIKATLRRQLQTTPDLFRHVEGMKGWYELVSYKKKLDKKDRKIVNIAGSQITTEVIITAFMSFDTLIERLYAKSMMQLMFRGNKVWERAYKQLKRDGYFKEPNPQVIINNPQFDSLYGIKGNEVVNIER